MGFRLPGQGFPASRLIDGAVLEGDGTFTFPDGTVQRPGTEHIAQTLAAAGTQIEHGSSKAGAIAMRVESSAGALTLSATPTIEAGAFDGQELLIIIDKDTVGGLTFQDESTLPGSGLRLNAASIAANARDCFFLTWVAEESAWYLSGTRVQNM
jgi:hypothetical protein